jgi:acetoin utilization deacetylase AcuC-like enzyme
MNGDDMKGLINAFEEFKIKQEKYSQLKTGLTFHKDMLQHTIHPDLEKSKEHKENPNRVIEMLNYIKKIDLWNELDKEENFGEIDWKHIEKIHGEPYILYIKKLFETKFEGVRFEDGNTYYMNESLRAALLAAEGTRLLVQNIVENKWRNGFAVVRPPGHHACAKDNKIGGFCLFNNVAIAAQYLVDNFQKRVLIFDWDVHHGDSTQKLFYNRNDVLYISIHKYLNGEFYPGESGDRNNVGEKEGEGYNLNFPLNPLPQEIIGDQEYIYIFERAVLPIAREFKPDFILISSGFDCLLQDPIGQLNVTWDSLGYMLFKLKNIITENIAVVLEGGYNLENIPKAFESLLRILNNEFFPNKTNLKLIVNDKYFKLVRPSKRFLQNCDENLNVWRKYWKCLNEQKISNLDNKIRISVEEEDMFPHNVLNIYKLVNNRLIKIIDNKENTFFCDIYPFLDDLQELIPQYYGVIKCNENDKEVKYLKLQNFKSIEDCNIIKFKLCGQGPSTHHSFDFFNKYKFLIQGYRIIDFKKNVLERKNNVYSNLSEFEVFEMFSRFFKNSKSSISKKAIQKLIKKIENLYHVVFQNSINISYVSVIIRFNLTNNDIDLSLLDFEHFELNDDQNCLYAINKMKNLFENYLKMI